MFIAGIAILDVQTGGFMRMKKIIVPALAAAIGCSLVMSLTAGQQDKPKNKAQAQEKAQEKVFIPPQVKAAIQEGLATKQGRQDIPVSIIYSLYLPTRDVGNFHNVFFMKLKNSGLGFAPPTAAPPAPAPKKGPQEAVPQEVPELLQAGFNVFLQFNKIEGEEEPQMAREVYVPTTLQVPAAGFDPEKEEVFSVGYPMPFGRYLVAIAVTSMELEKIGVAYTEIDLPDPGKFTKELDTTTIFFIKQMDQMEGVEQRTFLHQDFFTYANFKIVPNVEKVFNPGDSLDIFFYIFGTQPNEQQQFQIEVNFEVKKNEEFAIRWSPQSYVNPLISQPLPLKQTVKIKDEKGERTEQRDLIAGQYTLVVTITDKISGNTAVKTVDFEMK
jgi:hypothetical protein